MENNLEQEISTSYLIGQMDSMVANAMKSKLKNTYTRLQEQEKVRVLNPDHKISRRFTQSIDDFFKENTIEDIYSKSSDSECSYEIAKLAKETQNRLDYENSAYLDILKDGITDSALLKNIIQGPQKKYSQANYSQASLGKITNRLKIVDNYFKSGNANVSLSEARDIKKLLEEKSSSNYWQKSNVKIEGKEYNITYAKKTEQIIDKINEYIQLKEADLKSIPIGVVTEVTPIGNVTNSFPRINQQSGLEMVEEFDMYQTLTNPTPGYFKNYILQTEMEENPDYEKRIEGVVEKIKSETTIENPFDFLKDVYQNTIRMLGSTQARFVNGDADMKNRIKAVLRINLKKLAPEQDRNKVPMIAGPLLNYAFN